MSVLAKIDRIAMLPDGWDSHGGKAASPGALRTARLLASLLWSGGMISTDSVTLCSNGEIEFAWLDRKGNEVVTLNTDGTWYADKATPDTA